MVAGAVNLRLMGKHSPEQVPAQVRLRGNISTLLIFHFWWRNRPASIRSADDDDLPRQRLRWAENQDRPAPLQRHAVAKGEGDARIAALIVA